MIPRIAILGWGSLVWDPRQLKIALPWRTGGPQLPIEFSRISDNDRLTLVIDEQDGVGVGTRHALSTCGTLEDARRDLQAREETPRLDRIGYWNLATQECSPFAQEKHPRACADIRAWAEQLRFDAVVWTALGPNFPVKKRSPFSVELALEHLENLRGDTRAKAFEYIAKAPLEVMTPLRRALAQSN